MFWKESFWKESFWKVHLIPAIPNHAAETKLTGPLETDPSSHESPGSKHTHSRSLPADSALNPGQDSSRYAEFCAAQIPPTQPSPRQYLPRGGRTASLRAHNKPHRHYDEGAGAQSTAADQAARPRLSTLQSQNRSRHYQAQIQPAPEQQ